MGGWLLVLVRFGCELEVEILIDGSEISWLLVCHELNDDGRWDGDQQRYCIKNAEIAARQPPL